MKRKCRIEIESNRKIQLPEPFGSPPEEGEAEEWEELLWQEGFPQGISTVSDRIGPGSVFGADADRSVLTADGVFSVEGDGSYRVTYEDTEITGLDGVLTTFCLAPSGMLIMLRRGKSKTCMVFEAGHRHLCDYGAAGGISTVTLHTHRLDSRLGEDGGEVFVDYCVEIRGVRTEQNQLTLRIKAR